MKTSPGKSVNACPECGRKFGLVRQWLSGTSYCSRKCLKAYKDRRDRTVRWLRWLYSPPKPTRLSAYSTGLGWLKK